MTKASESLIEEIELKTEKIEEKTIDMIRKYVLNAWTAEEEQTLAELLKIHKWQEWDAIAADLKTRTAGAIESKVRAAGNSTHAFKNSKVKNEIIALAKMVKMKHDKLIEFLIYF